VVEKTPENIKHFYNILLETTTRDAFSGNSFEYYTQFLNTLTSSQLLLAYLDEEVIAGGIFVFDAEVSLYYYGASSNKHRNVMAPYLVQYTALCEAKNRGSRYYDFL
jgi:peptidoglycan pentaglycine glycine transferase (the first glycine)